MEKNQVIEVIVAIERAVANECSEFDLNTPKDRALLAMWINQKFVLGDFVEKAERREVSKQLPKTS